jgi:hypothetical protein
MVAHDQLGSPIPMAVEATEGAPRSPPATPPATAPQAIETSPVEVKKSSLQFLDTPEEVQALVISFVRSTIMFG